MTYQSAVIGNRSLNARFLVLRLKNGDLDALKRQMVKFYEKRHVLSRTQPLAYLTTAVSFGADLWEKLTGEAVPDFHAFEGLKGSFELPALPADIFVHLTSDQPDFCFLLAQSLMDGWTDVEVLDERVGFRHLGGRDLTGFLDGIENPNLLEDRIGAVLISEGPYKDGSFLFAARFVHNLDKWHATDIDTQQKVFGRTKLEAVEFPDDLKPKNAHIARTNIGIDIIRHNMPYGDGGGDKGVMFVGYAQQQSTLETQLRRMYGLAPDGVTDHLLDFTTAAGGAFYFTPSQDLLNEVMGIEDD